MQYNKSFLFFKQGSWTILLCFVTMHEPRECINIDRPFFFLLFSFQATRAVLMSDLMVDGFWETKQSGFESTPRH